MLHACCNGGAVRAQRGEEMAWRWALFASERWDAERRAGEVPAAVRNADHPKPNQDVWSLACLERE